MKKVLVTGGDSQLAECLKSQTSDYLFYNKSQLDVTNESQVQSMLANVDLVINLAAYTQVDLAEKEKDKAMLLNSVAVELLARHSKRLITLSTDYVFDGKKNKPYTEEDIPSPLNAYGVSKLSGEKLALERSDNVIIVRTSWLYSPYKVNFVKKMLALAKERSELKVVNDQWGTPTSGFDLAAALIVICNHFDQSPKGIYHFSNFGVCSWYDLASETLRSKGIKTQVTPVKSNEYKTLAVRPMYSALECLKIENAFGIKPRPWLDSLGQVLKLL